MNLFKPFRGFINGILNDPFKYQWSLQGFGMLRLNITFGKEDCRLNIWHDRYRVPNVSLIHTHPWDFDSIILYGWLRNIKYEESSPIHPRFYASKIKPGPKGGLRESPIEVNLKQTSNVLFVAEQSYSQRAEEIHLSSPCNGTVTFNHRERRDEDIATVFWGIDTEWVSAEPRNATRHEIEFFVANIWGK